MHLRSQPVLADKNIAANVYFNADAEGRYYVTTKLNLVKVQDNQAYIIAKLSPLENWQFPFMIYDEKQTQLFVNTTDSILNSRGTAAGYLEVR